MCVTRVVARVWMQQHIGCASGDANVFTSANGDGHAVR